MAAHFRDRLIQLKEFMLGSKKVKGYPWINKSGNKEWLGIGIILLLAIFSRFTIWVIKSLWWMKWLPVM
jgi:hypothetical protein